MKRLRELVGALVIGAAMGCGGGGVEVKPLTPLSFEEWKQLPVDQKYETFNLDRLRLSDPSLATDEAWDAFVQKNILPMRRRDNMRNPAMPR